MVYTYKVGGYVSKGLGKDYNIIEDILNKTSQEIENMDNINILVCGKTGSGKSTLINSLFRDNLAETGIGKPITQHLRKIIKKNIPLILYDTRGLELDADIQKQVITEINELDKKTKDTKDQLNLCYYCVNAGANRIEPMEIDLIKQISEKIPVIIVLTMSIGELAKDLKSYIENLNLSVIGIINVMAKDYKVSDDYTINAFGLKELVGLSLEAIPEETRRAFNNAQQADIDRKAEEAARWAKKYVAAAFGVGFTPIPFADASLLVPMQVTVIAHITAIFGISLDKSAIVSLVAAIGGTGGATVLGRSIVSNIMKFVPGANIAGGAISGATAALVTSALASAYIKVLSIIAKREYLTGQSATEDLGPMMKEEFKNQLAIRKNKDIKTKEKQSLFLKIRNKFKKN